MTRLKTYNKVNHIFNLAHIANFKNREIQLYFTVHRAFKKIPKCIRTLIEHIEKITKYIYANTLDIF